MTGRWFDCRSPSSDAREIWFNESYRVEYQEVIDTTIN